MMEELLRLMVPVKKYYCRFWSRSCIIVKPNEGKTVKIFSINGTPIQENNLTEDEDGTAVIRLKT